MAETISIEGLDELLKGLRRLAGTGLRTSLRRAGMAIGEEVRGVIAVYPAQRPPANPNHWYQRGYGTRWRRKDGSVGGRKTSEQLGQRWAVKARGGGVVVGNIASYSPEVHEAEQQTAVHKRTGWVTDAEAVQRVTDSGVATEIVVDAVLGAVEGMVG